ncbi:MAG: RdgB/HAM1 family non-canonical purine NTP pyrophosphatase [Saprospiraceae bacterium]|nr:RdgB/HAM1 family non-canonical purine NTP pyrophosphatase [Saprospiraceae bacterium]
MIQLLFASANAHKLSEINAVIPEWINIISMKDFGIHVELPETGHTIEENAIQKARAFYKLCGQDCFSEDSGLEVTALNDEPGVDTAMYAGPQRDAGDNMDLLLKNLEGKSNRDAQFRTVIALIFKGELQLFEGVVRGQIAFQKSGNTGFGYDPLFIPEGHDQTFAQLSESVKTSMSHRTNAVKKMLDYLNHYR